MQKPINVIQDLRKKMIQDRLNTLIQQGKLSVTVLHELTKVSTVELQKFLEGDYNSQISDRIIEYLFNLSMLLLDGIENVDADEHVTAVLDEFIQTFKLDYKAIAFYAKVEEEDVKSFHKNIQKVPFEVRYKISVKVLMLHYILKYTDYEKINIEKPEGEMS